MVRKYFLFNLVLEKRGSWRNRQFRQSNLVQNHHLLTRSIKRCPISFCLCVYYFLIFFMFCPQASKLCIRSLSPILIIKLNCLLNRSAEFKSCPCILWLPSVNITKLVL